MHEIIRNKSQFGGVNSPSDGILGFLSGMPENPVISVIRPKYRYSSHPAATIQVVMQPTARNPGGSTARLPKSTNTARKQNKVWDPGR